MLKQIKLGILTIVAIAFLAACSNDNSAREQAVEDATAVDGANVVPTANAEEPAAPVGPTTTLAFNQAEFDFGKVKAGPPIRYDFKFKNTGKEPLIITNAKGSCGCTVPDWPKEPIPVGGTGIITIEFDTKGRSGLQAKQVTVTANTDPPQTILYIKGELIAEETPAGQ